MVVDRRRGHHADVPGRPQRDPGARSPAGDQPGLGMGRAGAGIRARAEPAEDHGRVDRPARRAGGDGGGRLSLRTLSGRRRAARAPRLLQAAPDGGDAAGGDQPPGGLAGVREPLAQLERAVVHVRAGQLAGRIPGRAAGRDAGPRLEWSPPPRERDVARLGGAAGGDPDAGCAPLPDPDQEPKRLHRPGGRAGGAGLVRAAPGPPEDAAADVAGGDGRGRGTGRRRGGDQPTRPPGTDRIDQVAALSLGILGRCLAGHHQRAADDLDRDRAGQLRRRLRPLQAAAGERGGQGPAQPVARGLVDGRRLGGGGARLGAGAGPVEHARPGVAVRGRHRR